MSSSREISIINGEASIELNRAEDNYFPILCAVGKSRLENEKKKEKEKLLQVPINKIQAHVRKNFIREELEFL